MDYKARTAVLEANLAAVLAATQRVFRAQEALEDAGYRRGDRLSNALREHTAAVAAYDAIVASVDVKPSPPEVTMGSEADPHAYSRAPESLGEPVYLNPEPIGGGRIGAVAWRDPNQILVVVVSDRPHALKVIAERGWEVRDCIFLTEGIDLSIDRAFKA